MIRVYDNAGNVIETQEPSVLVILLRTSTQTGRSNLPGYAEWEIHPVMELQIVQ